MEVIININGGTARAEVIKTNPKKAKVKLLEQCRSYPAGSIVVVPYRMLTTADGKQYDPRGVVATRQKYQRGMPVNPASQKPTPAPDFYKNHFLPFVDRCVIQAMDHIYCSMSPEKISWGDERPQADVNRQRAQYHAQLKHLQEVCQYHYSEQFCSEAVTFWEKVPRHA